MMDGSIGIDRETETMAVFDTFSKRRRKTPEVLTYDEIPHELRIQILEALNDTVRRIYDRTIPAYRAIGTEGTDCFAEACLVLRRELGRGCLIELPPQRVRSMNESQTHQLQKEFTVYFENCKTENVLDSIEVVMHFIQKAEDERLLGDECNTRTVSQEINQRFLEHGIGYQYESGQIIVQTDSLLHTEAVQPTLSLLNAPHYANANEEFLKGHEHYRHERYQECLTECLKAFESTMKIICHRKGWSYKQTDTAKVLIKTCLDNGLVPKFSQQQLTSIRTLLESGIPTIRNKLSGHGQGVQQHDVPAHLAKYTLHMTAATILLLVECAE